jgi:N-methylhydantoinase B
MRDDLDPITFQVIKNSLISAAEEMKIVLAKTAYSPLLKLAGDYSCGIFDASGNMVAQGPDIPIHLGSMPLTVKAILATFERFAPGDVFIHNDPYFGGSHLPDVNVVAPIYLDEQTLLGFTCVRAHWPDIGSASPGSYGATSEIYGEGLRLPAVRLYTAGELNTDVDSIIFVNVRTPEERRGDLRAQIAANHRGSVRVQEMGRKYGVDMVMAIMQEVQDYSERMMRAQLARLDDGEFHFEDFCDGDGIIGVGQTEDEPINLKLKVIKSGDRMTIDFSGSDPQVEGPMNAPLAVTASGVYTAVKMIIDPNDLIPPNSGAWQPIDVTAPEGSVVNVLPPAPVVFANHEMTHRICDMVFGAVAPGYPKRVLACSQGTAAILTLGGQDPVTRRRYVSYETLGGGMGARPNQDGINAVKSGISNTMNTPIEQLEMRFPVLIDRYEIIPDSGGAGEYRGGCGVRRVSRILGHTAVATVCCERTKSAPFGLFGGLSGAPTSVHLVGPDGQKKPLNSKGPAFPVPDGSCVWYEIAGAGGYGEPGRRDVDRLASDVVNGYVSEGRAAIDYGVADAAKLRCPYCQGSEGSG